METLTALHVRSDVLVACQAKIAHAGLIGPVMATGALLLIFGVGCGELARHQQCFERGRSSNPSEKHQSYRHDDLQTAHDILERVRTTKTAKPRTTLLGARGLMAELL